MSKPFTAVGTALNFTVASLLPQLHLPVFSETAVLGLRARLFKARIPYAESHLFPMPPLPLHPASATPGLGCLALTTPWLLDPGQGTALAGLSSHTIPTLADLPDRLWPAPTGLFPSAPSFSSHRHK